MAKSIPPEKRVNRQELIRNLYEKEVYDSGDNRDIFERSLDIVFSEVKRVSDRPRSRSYSRDQTPYKEE
jgi:hypothetical protein